jgi:hypothetical protein
MKLAQKLSIVWLLVKKKQVLNEIQFTFWDTQFLRCTSPSDGVVTYFSSPLLIMMVCSALLGVLKMHSAQRGPVATEWSWNTQDYCKIHLTLSTYDSQAGIAAEEYTLCFSGQCDVDTSVFQQLEQCLQETGSVTSIAHVNTGHPWTVRTPANEEVIIAAVESELWRSTWNIAWELGLSQPRFCKYFMTIGWVHTVTWEVDICLWHQHAVGELLLDNILWTEELCFLFYCVFGIQKGHLWAWDNPHAILCDCEAIAYLRFCHLGQFSMEPSDYYDTDINKVLHFIWSAGLIKC